VIIMNTTLLQLGLLSLAIGVSASAQTYTTIMNGEDSQSYYFLGGIPNRTTVTSVQSPFAYPSSNIGATDSQKYPSGNGSGTPPWWFYYYTCGANVCTHDSTPDYIERPPSHGQISSQKSSVIGLLAKATLKGTATSSDHTKAAHLYEVFYFTERNDYAGQREIGFARQMSPYASPSVDVTFAYWYTNDNCGLHTGVGSDPNMGYPNCRDSRATTGNIEVPATAWTDGHLFAGGGNNVPITGLTTGTQYIYKAHIFWAGWDSTYKLRVEVWDSTFTTQIFASNLDTTNLGDSLGITTSGTSGYVTLGTVRIDPHGTGTLSSTGVELCVDYVQTITP